MRWSLPARVPADVHALLRSVPGEVALVDGHLRLVAASAAARALLGLPDQPGTPLLLPLVAAGDRARVAAALSAPGGGTVRFGVPAGPRGPVQLEAVVQPRRGSRRRVLQLRDVTSSATGADTSSATGDTAAERLPAFTDALTGLPNRALLGDALARGGGGRHVLLLDLDGVGGADDAGGRVLGEVARRLERSVDSGVLVARVGGAEFAVLVPGDLDTATATAQRLVDVLSAPYRGAGDISRVTASVGVALVRPGAGSSALRDADEALRRAKAAGGGWRVHSGHPSAPAPAGDLRSALAEGLLRVEYAVLSDPAAGRVVGLEATPVWDHPELGVLPAATIWSAADRQGAQRDVRRWLVGRACADVAGLPEQVHVGVPLAPTAGDADTLVDDVTTALAAAGLAASRLAVTFPEEVLDRGPAALVPALHVLHDRGVKLVLTDYGLGRTLWSHLTRVPVDAVVISLRTLATTGNAQHAVRVLRSMVEAAAEVGVRSVIADVEEPRVLATLTRTGALAMSGPLLPTGLGAGEAAALLAAVPAGTARR